jgi:hypothetical protein
MSGPSLEIHKIWIEQCAATEGIRERFGLESALDYLIGEKIFSFVMASERDPEFASELPAFIAEIRRLFTSEEIQTYLDRLEHTEFLAPEEPDWELDDPDEEAEDEPWPDNPVLGAEELLRFSRVRSSSSPSTEDRIHGQTQKGPCARGPNPQRSYRRCLWAGGTGYGLVLLPGRKNPIPVPGHVYRCPGSFAPPQRRNGRSSGYGSRRGLLERHARAH